MDADLSGRVIGNYEILKSLGSGGMGAVYKAHDITLNRIVALKVLPSRYAEDPAFVQRFVIEARAAARVNHPNVVTIFNIGGAEGVHFIAMEYVKGLPIDEILRREGPLDPVRALEIVRQVAGALAAAHDLGVIHRDIKPQNIMIDEAGRAKVMDFGIAKLAGEHHSALTRTGDVLGTPAYMSPEQCRGAALDGRSDLYSLGVVLYQMLAGRMPFEGDSIVAVIQKILFEPAPPLSETAPAVPAEIAAVAERLIAKDPTERHANCAELVEDIRRVLGGESPLSATGARAAVTTGSATLLPGAIQPPVPKRRSRIAALALLSVVAALLAVNGILLVMQTGTGEDSGESGPGGGNGAPGSAGPRAASPGGAAPMAAVPELAWEAAPDEGGAVWESPLRVRWRVANGAIAEGFLAGLNDTAPSVKITDLEKEFSLSEPGIHRLTIVPLGAGGARGPALERSFRFVPNEAPVLAVAPIAAPVRSGEMARLSATATDADGDTVGLRVRMEGTTWTLVSGSGFPVPELSPGVHPFEVLPVDSRGREGSVWRGELTIEPRPAPRIEALEFLTGVRGTVDETRARELIGEAAAAGDPLAAGWLAWFTHWGRCGVTKDPKEAAALAAGAIEGVKAAAEAGDREGLFLLGAFLDQGIGVEEDSKRALELVGRAAEAGLTSAMNYAGWMTLEGRGAKKSPAQAAEWFRKSAEAGDAGAMHNYGWMLAQGSGVDKDPKAAMDWFRKGAEAGSAVNMTNVGALHHRGLGVPKDLNAAEEWYRKAADLGDPSARKNLEMLRDGKGK